MFWKKQKEVHKYYIFEFEYLNTSKEKLKDSHILIYEDIYQVLALIPLYCSNKNITKISIKEVE